MVSFESAIFALSSLITVAAIFYKAPINILEEIIAVFLVIILFFVRRFLLSTTKLTLAFWYKNILLLSSSLIVQLIVLSSGGFFSPFLILLHLYTLGTSFLLNLSSSVSFLIFSLTALLASLWFNPALRLPIYNDPFTFGLYLISFIIIIPLVQLVNRSYHIKDTIAHVLSENLYKGQLREKSILQGLKELVLVTDENLKITSINHAVEETLNFSSKEIIGKKLLEVLFLVDNKGIKATEESLSIKQVLIDKTARIIKGFSLAGKSKLTGEVTIQARPITDLNKRIDQFVFVIKEGNLDGVYSRGHRDLEQARKKSDFYFNNFINTLSNTSLPNIKLKAYLLKKIEEDILIAQELEDHKIEEIVSFPDVAEMCQQVLIKKEEFVKSFNVTSQFILRPEDPAELSRLSLKGQYIQNTEILSISRYAVPIDPRWLRITIDKLLDISILLASGTKDGKVELIVSAEDPEAVNIAILTIPFISGKNPEEDLVSEYFGQLGTKTNLKLGSGLEGFIAKTIADSLNLPLKISLIKYPSRLKIILHLRKDRNKNTVIT